MKFGSIRRMRCNNLIHVKNNLIGPLKFNLRFDSYKQNALVHLYMFIFKIQIILQHSFFSTQCHFNFQKYQIDVDRIIFYVTFKTVVLESSSSTLNSQNGRPIFPHRSQQPHRLLRSRKFSTEIEKWNQKTNNFS